MRNSTGQLADQVQLLGTPKRRVRLVIGDLTGETRVGLGELARSFGDQLLEVTIDAPSFLFRVTHAGQRMHSGE